MLQDDRQCSLMPITPTKLMQSIPFPWSLLFTNCPGQQNMLMFYFYNCILHCYFLCCSPHTLWFWVQFLQGHSEIRDKTRECEPLFYTALWVSSEKPSIAPSTTTPAHGQPSEMGHFNPPCSYKTPELPILTAQDSQRIKEKPKANPPRGPTLNPCSLW